MIIKKLSTCHYNGDYKTFIDNQVNIKSIIMFMCVIEYNLDYSGA